MRGVETWPNEAEWLIDTLPPAPSGWRECGYIPLSRSAIVLTRQCEKTGAEPQLRLSRYSAGEEETPIMVPGEPWDCVESLPDGQWLVVTRRARKGEANARIYDREGNLLRNFPIGDAVLQIACTPAGILWVGYFDEHQRASGLAAFDLDGVHQTDVSPVSDPWILDCYALTTSGEDVWACTYTDFPIIRAGPAGDRIWANQVRGAKAIAVFRDHILLAGGYESSGHSDRLVLLRLEDSRTKVVAKGRESILARPGTFFQGRGGALHVVSEGQWRRLEVSRLLKPKRA